MERERPPRGPTAPRRQASSDIAPTNGRVPMHDAVSAHGDTPFERPPRAGGEFSAATAGGDGIASRRGLSSSMRLDSLKHFAGLLIAEKPMEAHRAYQRRCGHSVDEEGDEIRPAGPRGGSAVGGAIDEREEDVAMETLGPSARPPSPPLPPRPLSPVASFPPPTVPSGGKPGRPDVVPQASSAAWAAPADARASARFSSGNSAAEVADAAAADGAADPAYEEFRRSFKRGWWYRTLRGQIVKNKRRRGRAGYVERLKAAYNAIVPCNGRKEPQALPAAAAALTYAYVLAMVVFDWLTPTLLGVSASLVVGALAACMAFTTMFQAGQRLSYIAAVTARDPAAPSVQDKFWGPRILWRQQVLREPLVDTSAGLSVVTWDDTYRAEWGAVGPAVSAAASEGWRYIASLFVHKSFWHMLLLAAVMVMAGGLLERRYGIMRTAVMAVMFAITGSMAAVLALDDCGIASGASPLAWGFMLWWIVDTSARLTLWPWRDRHKILKTVYMWKNWSTFVLIFTTGLTLVIAEAELQSSNGAAAACAAFSALMITPAIAPRWNKSVIEAASVGLALVGIIIFWLIIPIAGAVKIASISDSVIGSCPAAEALRADDPAPTPSTGPAPL